MRRARTTLLVAIAAVLSGCGEPASNPGWDDVAALFASNCVRCHSVPAIGGAPETFRLDVWQDTVDADGRRILGAGAMAEFAASRAGDGSMPPRELELDDDQSQTLDNWLAKRADEGFSPPPGQPGVGNEPPIMRLRGSAPALDGDEVAVDYEIADDGDMVIGELVLRGATDLVVARDLRTGRHTASFDSGVVPAGSYRLLGLISDHPNRTIEVDLGAVTVTNPDDNVAPRVSFENPTLVGSIFADGDSPVAVRITIDDPDSASFELSLEAARGNERVVIADQVAASSGTNEIAWDTTALTEGPGWTLLATVSDGQVERKGRVGNIVITHATTDLRWSDVADIFVGKCSGCHFGDGSRVPGLNLRLGAYENDSGQPGVYSTRGLIYRRVALQANMPPNSAADLLPTFVPLSMDERQLIAEWLEGGAPQ